MTIRAKIEQKMADIEAELVTHPAGDGPIAKAVREGAINAIHGGASDWVQYMQLFGPTTNELARMIPTDGTNDPDKREARAYLVSNGVCAPGTATGLINNVLDRLDTPPVP
jgi:hypothetical protein